MPEGPEIRRAADHLRRRLAGRRADAVWFAFPRLRVFGDRLAGRLVVDVEARGKALLTRFEGGVNVFTHNQLYGRWFVVRRGRLPATSRQLRFAVHTATASALLYSASAIEVLGDDELDAHPFLSKLGPDVLAPRVLPAMMQRRLGAKRFRRRSLGALLLDQGFVAGLGNYLRSEILFVAGVDADLRPTDLGAARTAALADAIVAVPRQSYRAAGVTNDLDDARRLRAEGVPRRSYRHFVFARDGQPCRRCGEKVLERACAGRRLYWCPGCQG